MVSDVSEKILDIIAKHLTAKSLTLRGLWCCGATIQTRLHCSVKQSQITRYCGVCQWPSTNCSKRWWEIQQVVDVEQMAQSYMATQSVKFIDNFNIYWEHRHLFKADGFCLNKSGVRMLTSNIYYSVYHTSVPPSKDIRQDKPKQLTRQPLDREQLLPEISFEQTWELCKEKESLLPSSPKRRSAPKSQQEGTSTLPNQPTLYPLPSACPLPPSWISRTRWKSLSILDSNAHHVQIRHSWNNHQQNVIVPCHVLWLILCLHRLKTAERILSM